MFCEIETRDCPRARKFQEFPYLNDVAGRMLQYESENDSDAISELHRGLRQPGHDPRHPRGRVPPASPGAGTAAATL